MSDTVGIYFSLGSNLGERETLIRKAISLLEVYFLSDAKVSSLIETEPWGFSSENKFINCVIRFDIPAAGQDPFLHSHRILSECKRIESSLGREQKVEFDPEGNRIYYSRTIDIDILFYGNERIDSSILHIPHKLIGERDFVLIPLNEVIESGIMQHFPDIFRSK